MKLRELPGALILGLLASLLAHTASYGGGHASGGIYHAALTCLALAGAVGFALLLGLVAWFYARRLSDGSILASRLAPLLPNAATVMAFGTASFFAIEALESRHEQAPLLVVALALALASFVLCKLGLVIVRAIAHVVFSLTALPFANRRPAFLRRAARVARVSGVRHTYRRHARPPPCVMLVPA